MFFKYRIHNSIQYISLYTILKHLIIINLAKILGKSGNLFIKGIPKKESTKLGREKCFKY